MQHQNANLPLGAFIRARRLQADPAAFGIRAGSRRRTPGLRREELAQLCGVSVTWLTWIEQGRAASMSAATLLALSRGLNFSRAEREYLFRLAGKADPSPPTAARADGRVLQRLVDRCSDPAYIIDRYWDAIAWNASAARLFPAWLKRHAEERRANLLHYVFLEPAALRQLVDWKRRARRLVAEFRADTAALRGDPLHAALVDDLARRSAAFATAWKVEDVQSRVGGERQFRAGGRIRKFEQVTLRLAHQPELKFVALLTHNS